jgi:hypothetical protein
MIIEKENFISNELCDFFVKYHNTHSYDAKHRNSEAGYIFTINCDEKAAEGNPAFKLLLNRLTFFADKILKNTFVDYSQIVKWPEGEWQDEHLDFQDKFLSSVLNLNDNYEGGETVIEGKIIKPKKGKIVLFNGTQQKHKVLPITSGTRYTNTTWYINRTEEEVIK